MKPLAYLTSPVIAFLAACSSSTPPATVQLPDSLTFASIAVAGSNGTVTYCGAAAANTWTRSDKISLTLSCDNAPLIVKTAPTPTDSAIDNFTLAVPGGCGSLVSCGWLVLRVDPGTAAEIDVATWEQNLACTTVYGVTQPGEHEFALELHDASDNALHTSKGNVYWDQQIVDFLESSNCSTTVITDAG